MDETYIVSAEVSAQKIDERGFARRVALGQEARGF
jgi:hypothetical protein